MAVPAQSPKALSEKPNRCPRGGNINTAIMLNKNMVEIEYEISISSASIIGEIAAIAEPPHIAVPTPIKAFSLFYAITTRAF